MKWATQRRTTKIWFAMDLRLHKMTFSIFLCGRLFPFIRVTGVSAVPEMKLRLCVRFVYFIFVFLFIFILLFVVVCRSHTNTKHAPTRAGHRTASYPHIHRRRWRRRWWWFYVYDLTRIYCLQYHYHSLSLSFIYSRPRQSHLHSIFFLHRFSRAMRTQP